MLNDLTLNITNAYLQILLAKEQSKISQKQITLTLKQLAATSKQIDAGVLTESSKADIQAQLARDSATLINAHAQVKRAILQMKTLLNLDFKTGFIPQNPEKENLLTESLLQFTPEDIYQNVIQHEPGILADSLELLSGSKQIAAAKANLLPVLSLGAQIASNYSSTYTRPDGEELINVPPKPIGNTNVNGNTYVVHSFPTTTSVPKYMEPTLIPQLNENLQENIFISLSIPVFNGWQTKAQIKNMKIDREVKQLKLKEDLLQLKQDIYNAYYDTKFALKNYKAAKATLRATTISFSYAQKKYENGFISSLEYLTVQNDFFKAQYDLAGKYYDYVFTMKVLDFYKNM